MKKGPDERRELEEARAEIQRLRTELFAEKINTQRAVKGLCELEGQYRQTLDENEKLTQALRNTQVVKPKVQRDEIEDDIADILAQRSLDELTGDVQNVVSVLADAYIDQKNTIAELTQENEELKRENYEIKEGARLAEQNFVVKDRLQTNLIAQLLRNVKNLQAESQNARVNNEVHKRYAQALEEELTLTKESVVKLENKVSPRNTTANAVNAPTTVLWSYGQTNRSPRFGNPQVQPLSGVLPSWKF